MSKSVLIGIASAVAILGFVIFLTYTSMHGVKYRANVCVTFHGQTECRTASADSQEHAQRTAQSNACGLLASGVTDTMQCEHLEPTSVKWLDSR